MKAKIITFIDFEKQNKFITSKMTILPGAFPVLIGPKGATIRKLEEDSKCKFDLQKSTKKCTLTLKGR